jgi:hypothetical protein
MEGGISRIRFAVIGINHSHIHGMVEAVDSGAASSCHFMQTSPISPRNSRGYIPRQFVSPTSAPFSRTRRFSSSCRPSSPTSAHRSAFA